jgi:APA family basic amino acid/polyamine antiporter
LFVLSAGQAALGLAQDGLLPSFFTKTNKHGAPTISLLISCFGIVPILILTANESLVAQVNMIIEFSVTAFLFIYAICVAAFFKLSTKKQEKNAIYLISGIVSGTFCLWVLSKTPWQMLALASLFAVSGIPIFIYHNRPKKKLAIIENLTGKGHEKAI